MKYIKYTALLFFLPLYMSAFANATDSESNMLYREAVILYSDANYKEAKDRLSIIQGKNPRYERIKQVLIMEIFFNFLDEKYPEAFAGADAYLELYEGDENTSYIYFIRAESLTKQKKSPTKEFHLIDKNIEAWNAVLETGDAKYKDEALKQILLLEGMRALHDYRIGMFYYERGEYLSAIRRFNDVLSNKSTKYNMEAYKRLSMCYKRLNMYEQAKKYQDLYDTNAADYVVPEELGIYAGFKGFLYDMVPGFGFLPNWMKQAY